MAAVLEALVPKLAGILAGMAKEEMEMLVGAPGEITKLEENLGRFRSFLADADKRRTHDSPADLWADRWVRELKDAMYDADDILDLCQILEQGEDPMLAKKPAPWRRNIPLLFCFSNQFVPHQIRIAIKSLNQRLEDIAERSSHFGLIRQAVNSSSHFGLIGKAGRRRIEWAPMQRDVVGEKIEADTKKLVDLLLVKEVDSPTRSDIDNVVVAAAITGACGTGKTTLALMVFNNSMVNNSFDVKIWLSLDQEVNEIALLQSIIAQVGGNYNGIAEERAKLENCLKLAVRQKKFLLVMDNVWSDRVWNELLKVPLDGGAPGSRVLVITRNDGVARGMKAQNLHRVTTLDLEDAWILLKKQVVLSEEHETNIDALKDIGLMIIHKCSGLPLPIKLVGELLCTREQTRRSWLSVLHHYSWSSGKIFDDLYDSLYLSYQELNPQLKQCFLYYSLLPKGVNFDAHQVSNMWISEGFIQQAPLSSYEIEDIGTEYHQDLIMRNLIEPGASSSMHDIVRSFAQHIAREESLVVQREQQTEISSHLGSKLRRLSIESTESISLEWSDLHNYVSLRVFIIINCTINFKPGDSLSSFSNLRVLHIARLAESDRGFGRLINLRSLFGFPVHTDDQGEDWCSLEELAPLRQLRNLRLEGTEKVNPSYLAAKAMISSKEYLSSLHLNCSNNSKSRSANVSNSEQQQQQIIEVYERLLVPPPCLETLVMESYIGRRLPNWMWAPGAAVALGHLRYMSLHNLASCIQLPDGLCQIPCLERLEINKAPLIKYVGPEFLHHAGLRVAFPRLQELVSYGMVEWCDWEWDPLNGVQAMPALEVLLVESCKLRSFPPGLSCHARALRQLVITGAQLLESLEMFPSLVELDIGFNPELSRIANLPRLQNLTIKICSKLRVLEGVPALSSLAVKDYKMKTLPGYLQDVCPRYLTLDCTIKLLKSISMRNDGPEWHKISHIQHVNAYAEGGGCERKRYLMYTRKPYSFQTYMPDSEGVDDSELVGIESPREEIIRMLMHGQDTGKQQPQVVSIYGIGGLGKTYDNEGIIKSIFDQVRRPYSSLGECAGLGHLLFDPRRKCWCRVIPYLFKDTLQIDYLSGQNSLASTTRGQELRHLLSCCGAVSATSLAPPGHPETDLQTASQGYMVRMLLGTLELSNTCAGKRVLTDTSEVPAEPWGRFFFTPTTSYGSSTCGSSLCFQSDPGS
ncbi:Disease resistance protein RGA2 [Dichanthelium oligosanthes]|uniref:Disease resistance protein RGA2 n=1 Tax=Dichanthelium oligosanthes TaxID=888268 RepID=A0A1E5US67_9POAL|nr:Disease resistance protein RGA2 [Dichanthelium oligosanthes]